MSAGTERIIVFLDDVEQMTAIGADLLQRRLDNVKVVPFNKPRDALAWMRAAPRVDVVLSDFHMADMDGIAFLAQARTLHPAARRAIMTAYLDLPTTKAAELGAQGVHALIRKPWEWSDFTRAVFELMALSPAELAAIERVGPVAYPEGAFAELAASRAAHKGGPPPQPRAAAVPVATAAAAAPSPSSGAAGVNVLARAMPTPTPVPVHAPSGPPPSPAPSPAASPPSSSAPSPAASPAPSPAPCPHCGAGLSPIPSVNDDEETVRLLTYLQTRPGVAARIRAAIEQAAQQQQQQQRRAPPPGRGG